MKKIVIIISIAIVVIAASGIVVADKFLSDELQSVFDSANDLYNSQDKNIIVTVDGVPIYQENIDFLFKSKELSIKNTTQSTLNNSEDATVNIDEIIEEKIRSIVTLNEAKKQGLEVSYKEAKEYEEEMFSFIEEDKESDSSKFIFNFIKETNMTIEEYREKAVDVYRDMLTRAALYDKFAEDKEGTYDEIVAQYEAYIDVLVEKADIVYK